MKLSRFFSMKRALLRLRAMIRSQPFTILLFHSVGRSPAADFLSAGLNCDPGFFRALLKLLVAEATVIRFGELATAIREKRVPQNAVVITFDDGFRDTLTMAWPLLKEFRLPAILFTPTDSVGSDELLPLHQLYYNNLLSGPNAPASNSRARGDFIQKLLHETQHTAPSLGRELYLSWDELRMLQTEGMEIGGHTCSHAWLAALPIEEQRREIVESKIVLEKNLGRPVEYFAYPFGYYGTSFTDATLAIVRQHFVAAVGSMNETTDSIDLYRLPRHSINTFYSV